MPANFAVKDLEGLQALDYNQQVAQNDGHSVVSGCEVTINTGNIGKGNAALSISAGEALVGGKSVTVNAQSVDVPAANDSAPRKDIVYIDDMGAPQVKKGTAEPQDPASADPAVTETERPAPHHWEDYDTLGPPVCIVWVGDSADAVKSYHLDDRRMFADSVRWRVMAGGVMSRTDIDAGMHLTIPTGYSDVVTAPYEVDGTVTVEGRLKILPQ